MTTEHPTPDEAEANLKSITDSHKLTDDIIAGKKIQVFRCAGSGLYFPADYVKNWGRKYGIGLGQRVVSECLETDWNAPLAVPANLRSPEQIMYPLMQGDHQVDAYILSPEAYAEIENQQAVIQSEDLHLIKRATIIRGKQLTNSNGRLSASLTQHKV